MRNKLFYPHCKVLLTAIAAIFLCHCADTMPSGSNDSEDPEAWPAYEVRFEDDQPETDNQQSEYDVIGQPVAGVIIVAPDVGPEGPADEDDGYPDGDDPLDEDEPVDEEEGNLDDDQERAVVTPVVESMTVQTFEDTSLSIVMSTEQAVPSDFRFNLVLAPSHGTLDGDLPAVTYIPYTDFSGGDVFEVALTNGQRTSAPAVITVDVVEGSILYVSVSGDDANPGTTAEIPFRTIATALDAADEDGNDIVVVDEGVYTESIRIQTDVTIMGAGPEETFISGTFSERPIDIARGVAVTITDLTIADGEAQDEYGGGIVNWGDLRLERVSLLGNRAGHSGGAIATYGTLSGNNVTFSNNSAGLYGGGLYNHGTLTLTNATFELNQVVVGNGAGVFNGGVASLEDCAFFDNYGVEELTVGGGLASGSGSVSIVDSRFEGNHVNGSGGAIFSRASELTLKNVQITDNTALSGDGGGIHSSGQGNLYMTATEVSFNSAGARGGGIYSVGPTVEIDSSSIHDNTAETGGGAEIGRGETFITNTTISNNQATRVGGLSVSGTSALISNVTVAFNEAERTGGLESNADDLTLVNSILAFNIPTDCADIEMTSFGFDLVGDASCGFEGPGDLNKVDAGLLPLSDNGGPTLTHFLFSDSPAINAADPHFCPSFDQRGMPRDTARCDIGALELQE